MRRLLCWILRRCDHNWIYTKTYFDSEGHIVYWDLDKPFPKEIVSESNAPRSCTQCKEKQEAW